MANFRDRYKTLWARGIEMKALILILTLSSSLNINANSKDNIDLTIMQNNVIFDLIFFLLTHIT